MKKAASSGGPGSSGQGNMAMEPIMSEEPQIMSRVVERVEEGEKASHAQRVVRELYLRYQKQLQRWKDYRNLLFFLTFVALFLGVLYTQRQANTAYKVHATLSSTLVPSEDVLGSSDEVYTWLKNVLQNVWVDPKCGDGLCESPFEYPSYSSFGCRADCGKLQDIQKLTPVQVDVQYDFSHPIGSMPSSELMQQASWNICPKETAYSGNCYYDQDQQFDRLSGQTSTVISDMPDGQWDFVMRRDIFYKTRGAVRDFNKLNAVSYYYRVYMAAVSAFAEQNIEMSLLNYAIGNASLPLLTYIKATLDKANTNSTFAQLQYDQLMNAACGCDTANFYNTTSHSSNSTALGDSYLIAFNNTKDGITNLPAFKAAFCGNYSSPELYDIVSPLYEFGNGSSTTTLPPAGTNYTVTWSKTPIAATTNATAEFCFRATNNLTAWRTNHTQTVRQLMIDLRLGDQRTTGKIAARNTALTNMRTHVANMWSELYDHIFTYPTGPVAVISQGNATLEPSARIDVLQEQFVAGLTYFFQYQPAFLGITRRVIYTPNITLPSVIPRAAARLNETRFQQLETLNIKVPVDLTFREYGYPSTMTVEELVRAFYAALGKPTYNSTRCPAATCLSLQLSDNSTVYLPTNLLPDASSPELNTTVAAWGSGKGLQTDYNLVTWGLKPGNNLQTAYLTCNMADRQPDYIGTCQPMNVSCAPINMNDTVPWTCISYGTGAQVNGDIYNIGYRQECSEQCDRLLDCNAICDCTESPCGGEQVCTCKACDALNLDPTQDSQFLDIRQSAIQSGNATAIQIADRLTSGSGGGAQRRLLQTSSTPESQLNAVINQLNTVSGQQATISSQMSVLQQQVADSNRLAEQRANDNRVITLIQQGREEIATGQARVEAKLDEIIGKQQQSLKAAEDAIKALGAIKDLTQRSLAATQALEKAVQSQLTAIKTATYQGIISLSQALQLWKRARRDRAVTLKAAQLANIPCDSAPVQDNMFELDNGNEVDISTARERDVGLTNRVLSGMLLHQVRTNETACTDSKFNKIQQTCTGPTTIKPFGVDPVFKRATTLYNSDFDDVNGTKVVQFYNCSLLSDPTYNVPFLNSTTNPAPYCAELYNSQKLPYAFHAFPLEGKDRGFPVVFDINLSQEGAGSWATFLEEGLFLDQHSRSLTAELVTYNAPLRIFGYFFVRFAFSDGGSIKVTHRLHTVRVELYSSSDDSARYAFEVILSLWIFAMLLYTVFQIILTQKREKNFLKFFTRGWNIVDFISNGLLAGCVVIWWVFVTRYAKPFDTSLRHDVYASLTPDANYLQLNQSGTELVATWDDIKRLRNLIDTLNWYFALNGINILLLIARVLRLMDFQPRLGVVTRSLWLAGPDLCHFAIVAGMVFVGYAMMAHLIFGNAIDRFQTFGDSVNTCFEILLGDIDVNTDLRALGGLQSVAGALFFWSYELLVFMVLLNFLLAIIVDAFSEVKEKTHETVGMHTELAHLLRDKWRSLLGACSSRHLSDSRLSALLKQWAGDQEEEDDKKQVQGQVQKLLTIMNEDLDEEDLRHVLMECLRDAPHQEGQDGDNGDGSSDKGTDGKGGKEAAGGVLGNCVPTGRRLAATPAEIMLAAKYIVDRFGVPVAADESAEGNPFGGEDQDGGGDVDNDTMGPMGAGASGTSAAVSAMMLDSSKETGQLAAALERLAEVQRELAEGQRNLMNGQRQLAEQQARLVQGLVHNTDGGAGSGTARAGSSSAGGAGPFSAGR